MKKTLLNIKVFLGICIIYQTIYADDLLEIYKNTMQFNSAYKADLQENDIKNAQKDEALSAFLPHASLSGSYGKVDAHSEIGPLWYLPTLPRDFSGRDTLQAYGIDLEQQIFDYSSWKALGAAKLLVEASKLKVQDQKQTLTFRVADQYFNTLREEEKLKFLSAEKASLLNEKKIAESEYQQGMEVKLVVDEIDSYLEAIAVEKLSIENDISNSLNQLSSISGKPVSQVMRLTKNMPITLPDPDNFLNWEKTSDVNNYAIRAATLKLQAAQEEIGMESGKWMPRVFATARYGYEETNVPVFQDLTVKNTSVFLGVSMPILTGGYISAKTMEVRHQYQQYNYELINAKQELDLSVQEVLQDINTLYIKLQADKSKINITQKTLDANIRAYDLGLKSIDESLSMQEKLIAAQNAYADDFYNYILLKLKLKELAGELTTDTIMETNHFISQN